MATAEAAVPSARQLHDSAEISDLTTGNKDAYTGLTDGTIRERISKHEGDCRKRDSSLSILP